MKEVKEKCCVVMLEKLSKSESEYNVGGNCMGSPTRNAGFLCANEEPSHTRRVTFNSGARRELILPIIISSAAVISPTPASKLCL